jgi:HEAT repeat protein
LEVLGKAIERIHELITERDVARASREIAMQAFGNPNITLLARGSISHNLLTKVSRPEHFLPLTRSRDWGDQYVGIQAIGAFGIFSQHLARNVAPFLESEHGNLRFAAAQALAKMQNPTVLPELRQALEKERSFTTRMDIERAIRNLEKHVKK